MGARWGIKFTLIAGLTLQLFSYGLLFGWDDSWTTQQAILYVTFAQMFAGTCISCKDDVIHLSIRFSCVISPHIRYIVTFNYRYCERSYKARRKDSNEIGHTG